VTEAKASYVAGKVNHIARLTQPMIEFVDVRACYGDGSGTAPISHGQILTRKTWAELVASTNEWYATVTDAEIEYTNDYKRPSASKSEHLRNVKAAARPRPRPGYVYVLSGGDYHKIGFSKNVSARIKQISRKLRFDVKLVCIIETDDMVREEAYLHGKYTSKRIRSEWFTLSDEDLEWLVDTDALIYSEGYDTVRR